MAVSGPQNAGIPGYKPFKPIAPVRNTTGVGPQNVGLPGYRPGDVGNPHGALAPGLAAPAPLQAAQPALAAAPPPRADYWSLAMSDPQYTTGNADLQRQNDAAVAQLQRNFAQTSQGYQDNANAHNALFSGAAAHAQNYEAQNYANQASAQAQALQAGQHNLQAQVFQRLLTQLAGGGA